MNLKDRIGKRGENIFTVLITTWCNGKPLFSESFLGEKHEGTDFVVELLDRKAGHAQFYVQVKSTNAGYKGTGSRRKLNVKVSREDVQKLKTINAPTYIVGIDINKAQGFIVAVTQKTRGGISGIRTRHKLHCRTLKALWNEVDAFWSKAKLLPPKSHFS